MQICHCNLSANKQVYTNVLHCIDYWWNVSNPLHEIVCIAFLSVIHYVVTSYTQSIFCVFYMILCIWVHSWEWSWYAYFICIWENRMTIYWTNSVSVFVMVYFQFDKKKRWSSSHNLTRGSKCRKFKEVLGRTELMMTICDKMMRVAITRPRWHASKTIYRKLGHIYPTWNRLFPTLMVGRVLAKSWGSRERTRIF